MAPLQALAYNFFNPTRRLVSFDATAPGVIKSGTLANATGDLIRLRGTGGNSSTGANANVIVRPMVPAQASP